MKWIPQNGLFLCAQIWVSIIWKALDAQLLTAGQLLWYPLDFTGVTVQMRKVSDMKIERIAPVYFLLVFCTEFDEKVDFLAKRSVAENH